MTGIISKTDYAHRAWMVLWDVATSDNTEFASSASPYYQQAEASFLSALELAYGLTTEQAKYVRDEYAVEGPAWGSLTRMVTCARERWFGARDGWMDDLASGLCQAIQAGATREELLADFTAQLELQMF